MKVFISGGCKNGKSTIAEDIAVRLAAGRPLYYMATMIPHDEEDRVRIARHIEARKGKNFRTIECGDSLCDGAYSVSEQSFSDGVFLVDAVTALLSNHYEEPERVMADLKEFCNFAEDAVFVSDFIYSASEDYSPETEEYRKNLAACDRYLASVSDVVMEICAGQPVIYKGKELL